MANDQALWKKLCAARGWVWRPSTRVHGFDEALYAHESDDSNDADDEGMGDSDEEDDGNDDVDVDDSDTMNGIEQAKAALTQMHAELDSGSMPLSMTDTTPLGETSNAPTSDALLSNILPSSSTRAATPRATRRTRHSAPSALSSLTPPSFQLPNYKLLFQTHMRLRRRLMDGNCHRTILQSRGGPDNSHTNTIYCLQLYTYPTTGQQVLFTGSRDRTVREWNLKTEMVERVISGVHDCSVLSICAYNGYLASAGGDRRVVVWDLEKNDIVRIICDHDDSVLCVRFDDRRLVSCSKGISIFRHP